MFPLVTAVRCGTGVISECHFDLLDEDLLTSEIVLSLTTSEHLRILEVETATPKKTGRRDIRAHVTCSMTWHDIKPEARASLAYLSPPPHLTCRNCHLHDYFTIPFKLIGFYYLNIL